MRRGFMLRPDLVNDPACQRLPGKEFARLFMAAARGEQNIFSRFVKPWNLRPPMCEWIKIRERIFRRDNYTCAYCGIRGVALECDHIVPLSRGGPNSDDNLTTACRRCNQSKRDKTVEEWRAQRGKGTVVSVVSQRLRH